MRTCLRSTKSLCISSIPIATRIIKFFAVTCRARSGRGRVYDGRWWEFQANRAMGGLLCPRALVQEALKPFLMPSGSLGGVTLDESRKEGAARALADIFDVNPIVAKIRISELYPAETGQMQL